MQLTIHDLERETGLRRRTIHHYAHQGLLPSANGSGPSATYDEEHLLRLRLIPVFKTAGLRLDRIGRALDELGVDQMRRLVEADPGDLRDPHRVAAWLRRSRIEPDEPGEESSNSGRPRAVPEGCRSWLRHELVPGVELHFCAESVQQDAEFQTRLNRLDELVRELFEDFGS